MEQTHLSFMNFSKLLSTLALPALYRTSFLFFYFFFSLLNSKKGIGINFHMQHISHYTYIRFRPKIINGHVSSLAISIEDLLRVIHDALRDIYSTKVTIGGDRNNDDRSSMDHRFQKK